MSWPCRTSNGRASCSLVPAQEPLPALGIFLEQVRLLQGLFRDVGQSGVVGHCAQTTEALDDVHPQPLLAVVNVVQRQVAFVQLAQQLDGALADVN